MTLRHKNNEVQLFNLYIFNKLTLSVVDIILWGYYGILLYKATGNIMFIIWDKLAYFPALWVGFLFGCFALDRFGYRNAFRIAFFSMAASVLITFLLVDDLKTYFIPIAIIFGISRGIYWASNNVFELREMHGSKRAITINTFQSVNITIGVALPVLAGSLITLTDSYTIIFLLSFILYILAGVFPWSYNKYPRSRFTLSEVVNITKKKHFPEFALITMCITSESVIFGAFFSIVPYLLLKSEFDVGALISGITIFSAFLAFYERRKSLRTRERLGKESFFLYGIANVFFSFMWNIPMLIARSLSVKVAGAIGETVASDVDYRSREMLLGDFKNESALELNLVVETLYFFARIVSFSIILAILSLSSDIIFMIRLIIFVLGFFRLFIFFFQIRYKESLRR